MRSKHSNELTLAIIFIGIFVLMSILSPDKFLSGNNIKTMMFQMPEFGLMAIAMMIAVLTGGINLSITTGAALSSIVCAFILSSEFSQNNNALGIVLGLIACMAVAVICGVINGYVVAYIGVAAMLVTLGSKTLFEGLGLAFTKGGSISGFPEAYSFLGNGSVLGIPFPIILYIVVIIVSYLLIERSAWGTEVYMVGCNEIATRFSGINTKKTLLKVYIYSGVMSGLASILISSRYNSAKTDYGSSYMMQAVTAVVLGGTSISGGHGTVAGTVLAVAIVQVISTGLNILGVNRYIINIITGGILIVVLALRYITKVMEDNRKIKERAAATAK
ncbi:ABC transporter permease [Lachnospiraceae bacterium ASD5720]|uniref:ABC transporter permease n=1 Tax=Diplocloster agilis TaxID=2850323 RepID=A0A949JZV9_9FIRM|nr:ABC transporter permease [Diplocloster agilis]